MKNVNIFLDFRISGKATLAQVAGDISSGRFRPEIEEIRNLFKEGRTEEAQARKKLLPAFSPSGTFNHARKAENLIAYSGVVHLDFDHIPPERLENVFRIIVTLPFTYICFRSPSGTGLKVFVEVNTGAEHHAQAYEQVK